MDLHLEDNAQKEKKLIETGLAPGVKACHRFMIPFSIHHDIPQKALPGLPQQIRCQNQPQMGFMPCLKDKCSLWSGILKDCSEKIYFESQARMNLKELEEK